MQTEVSVKKPTRGFRSSPYVVLTARPLSQIGDELRQPRAAWTAAGPDVARERLDLLDVHVRVERHVGEVVCRAARRQPALAPVVAQPDLVDLAAPAAQRAHPVGAEA